jgi:hypothetical protein
MTTALVPSVSIAALVNARAGIIDRFDRIAALVEEIRDVAAAAKIAPPRLGVTRQGSRGTELEDISDDGRAREAFAKLLDRNAWRMLLDESGMRTFMDQHTRERWDEQIDKMHFPALTAEAVAGTFARLYESRGEMFEQGVIRCFRELSWDYKTNNPFRFGKRIVLPFLKGWSDSTYPDHGRASKLDDLVRVMSVLDGRPEPDHRSGMYHVLSQAMSEPGQRYRGETRTDYLRVKWFKNRSGHVEFLRPDLVDGMNAIIAKHYPGALPAPRAA